MKVVMVMFDSLNRHMLPPYGCDWTHAPNFRRLASRTVTFDRSYVCSMPCMPARRDMHTGRPNFLHRSWGPLEPFDDSMPQMLRKSGIWSHLSTDHYHYFEDGGATYHTRYKTWDFHRGQEGDPWIGDLHAPPIAPGTEPVARYANTNPETKFWQDMINRQHMHSPELLPQAKTFRAGLDFINRNHDQDNWFLQVETFDPHEPFFSHRRFKDFYAEHYRNYAGPNMDWPPYETIKQAREVVEHCRYEYASLLSMCDAHLGDVLDAMDRHNMWDDTMLIVWTDHGFLLGEHNCWAKCWMPFYEEVAHTPFFVWDPRSRKAGERRGSLVQPSIDIPATVLEYFGVERPKDMIGKPLGETIASDKPVRDAAIFGMFGQAVNVTDGRYVYMRAPAGSDNSPLYEHTVMPTHMAHPFADNELAEFEAHGPLSWTKRAKVMRIPTKRGKGAHPALATSQLFDLANDPGQLNPIQNAEVEATMIGHLTRLMAECDAPADQYVRLGLNGEAENEDNAK